MVKWMLTTALLAMPALAGAQTVTIKRGTTVSLIMGDDDAPKVATSETTETNACDREETAAFQRGDYAAAIGAKSLPMAAATGSCAAAPIPPRGKLVLRFIRSPNKDDALLSIQNGFARAFVYRATMTIDGKRRETDVCVVPPGIIGHEYWPYRIDSLDLSSIRLIPWSEGDRITCE